MKLEDEPDDAKVIKLWILEQSSLKLVWNWIV